MTRYLKTAFAAAAALLAASCIRNDIPYPVIELRIANVEGEGFSVSENNVTSRVVTLTLDEATDIRNVKIDAVTYDAIVHSIELNKAELLDQVRSSQELTGTFNLLSPIYTTLSLYQDYDWTIRATQTIERRFNVTGQIGDFGLVRTFCLRGGKVEFLNDESAGIIPQKEIGVPDYSGLLLDRYISVIEIVNPMHKLWSDGRWNKLTLAHGCYWGKCSFCDGSLDYIRRYEPNEVKTLVDRMEQVMAQTGEGGFHFVDEAAPPALLKELALEILRRRLMVVWWGNVRFERAYTLDLCRLLKASGCIAVSGGVEVASDRVLGLINKGVTLEQLTRSANHFTGTGIMVHAYLMYGFPTETTQETVDSLEVVRQLFELGYIHSGFWHRFAMTAHSPVGLCPERFGTRVTEPPFGGFARNDVAFEDLQGGDHDELGDGLSRSLYNYMRGVGFDLPLQKWFDCKIPATTIPPRFVAHMAEEQEPVEKLHSRRLCWLGGRVELGPESVKKGKYSIVLLLHTNNRELAIKMRGDWAHFIHESLMQVGVDAVNPYLLEDFSRNYEILFNDDFLPFWYSKEMQAIRDNGLLLL